MLLTAGWKGERRSCQPQQQQRWHEQKIVEVPYRFLAAIFFSATGSGFSRQRTLSALAPANQPTRSSEVSAALWVCCPPPQHKLFHKMSEVSTQNDSDEYIYAFTVP